MMWLRVAAAVALAVGLLTGAYQLGRTTMKGEFDSEALGKKSGEDATLKAVALAISKIEVKSEKHIQPLLTEVRTNTVYRSVDCQHSADSMRHLNALITGDGITGGSGLPEGQPTP